MRSGGCLPKLLICGEKELGEEYAAELVHSGCFSRAADVNPIVRVLFILRYPQQHAIYWPDMAVEIPPVRGGCVCRLPFLRAATDEETGRFSTYADSLAAAQQAALRSAGSAAERAIIQRHMAGEYHRRRAVREYKPYELDVIKRAWNATKEEL